jgi:hypothetical protein
VNKGKEKGRGRMPTALADVSTLEHQLQAAPLATVVGPMRQGFGRRSLHSLTHTGSRPQQGLFMQTSPLRHCEPEVQGRKSVQQGCTQRFTPETVLMQKHVFLVFVHLLSQLKRGGPLRGHVGAASAGLVNEASPTALTRDAPANRKARRLEMLPLERPLANSSKELSLVSLAIDCLLFIGAGLVSPAQLYNAATIARIVTRRVCRMAYICCYLGVTRRRQGLQVAWNFRELVYSEGG